MPFAWIMCDTADKKGLKRGLPVEASVRGDTHLEIRRGGILCVSVVLVQLRITSMRLGRHSQKSVS